jgi:hypothetical protein
VINLGSQAFCRVEAAPRRLLKIMGQLRAARPVLRAGALAARSGSEVSDKPDDSCCDDGRADDRSDDPLVLEEPPTQAADTEPEEKRAGSKALARLLEPFLMR